MKAKARKAIGGSGKFDESKHPRAEDGKFAASDRAKASLKDPEFVSRHGGRLSRAGDEVRRKYTPHEQGTDAVHGEALDEIHREAERIHVEDEAHGDDERLRSAADIVHRYGSGSAEERHQRALESVAGKRRDLEEERNADRAVEAGHIAPIPDAKFKAHKEREAEFKVEAKALKDDMDSAHQEALDAVDRFEQARDSTLNEDDRGERFLEADLRDEFNGVESALNVDAGGNDSTSKEYTEVEDDLPELTEPEEVAEPLREDFLVEDDVEDDDAAESGNTADDDDDDDDDVEDEIDEESAAAAAEYKAKVEADYKAAVADYEQYKRDAKAFDEAKAERVDLATKRADEAQAALERLHAKQIAALERAKEVEAEQEASLEAALEELAEAAGDDDADLVRDDVPESELEAAERASRRIVAKESAAREDARYGFSEDSVEAMKEAAKKTSSAIKQLARLTRRKPALPEKPAKPAKKPAKPKKSANRPGAPAEASFGGMARYKLRLSKLDFLSLVDEPAQQTAKVRLIKRAGSPDAVHAEMRGRVVKVTSGADPLVYCWAFTCTDDTGAPYHDLQGDAVSPEDFVKAAEEFMRAGGAVDEMHTGQVTAGRIAFAFPMDAAIATAMLGKAAGDATKTSGLMVAIRPTPEQLVKLRSGEYTGVSIAGTGTREVLEKGRKPKRPMRRFRYGKQTVLTSAEDGHQHGLDVREVCNRWYSGLTTSYATSEGAEEGHCHAWIFDRETGAVTIAMDSGHTHMVEAVVPADVLAEFAAMEARGPEADKACAPVCGAEHGDPGAKVVVVAARAPAGKSPLPGTAATVKSQEQAMATEQELQKRIAHLEKLNTLTDAQRAHHKTLVGAEADTFLAKSATERDTALAEIEKANEVVYTATDGSVFRKSDDPRLVAAVKRADEQAKITAAEIAKREQVELEKRAGIDLSHFAKAAPTKAALLRAVDGIADEAVRKDALDALRGANAALKSLAAPIGAGGGTPVDAGPRAAFDAELAEFAKSKSKTVGAATAEFIRTERGAELYAEAYPRTNA